MNAIFIAAILCSSLLPSALLSIDCCIVLSVKTQNYWNIWLHIQILFLALLLRIQKSKCLVSPCHQLYSIYIWMQFFFFMSSKLPGTFHRMMCDGTSLSKKLGTVIHPSVISSFHSAYFYSPKRKSFAFGKLLFIKLIRFWLIVAIHNNNNLIKIDNYNY
jgi:hypothetical protein